MKHSTAWHAPARLWDRALEDAGAAPARFRRPALLRFAGDDFMPALEKLLAYEPTGLADYTARPESWRQQAAGWVAEAKLAGTGPLKLYQPAHNRFYLLAASFVCRRPGLPDRAVDAASEKLSFVQRRLVPRVEGQAVDPDTPATYVEHGWFGDRQQGVWLPLADPATVAEEEERLPLFSLTHQLEGKPRRLHAGMIPVASREVYEGGARASAARPAASETAADPLSDPRLADLAAGPVAALEQLETVPDDSDSATAEVADARETLLYALADLAEILEREELGAVWSAIESGSGTGLSVAERDLYDRLNRKIDPHPDAVLWRQALVEVTTEPTASALAAGEVDSQLPQDVFGVALDRDEIANAAGNLLDAGSGTPLEQLVADALDDPRLNEYRERLRGGLDELAALGAEADEEEARGALLILLVDLAEYLARELPAVWTAMGAASPTGLGAADRSLYDLLDQSFVGARSWRELAVAAERESTGIYAGDVAAEVAVLGQPLSVTQLRDGSAELSTGLAGVLADAFDARPLVAQVALLDLAGTAAEESPALYVNRCVWQRPQCGKATPPVVSEPSPAYSLADFYDADAPIRPLSIRMPADTGIGSLRSFPKGVSFLLSDKLREQMARAEQIGMEGLIDGDAGDKPSFNLGVICSFSIPIISICALILLMIMVQLLNIIFWWLPFFKICLPIGLKGK